MHVGQGPLHRGKLRLGETQHLSPVCHLEVGALGGGPIHPEPKTVTHGQPEGHQTSKCAASLSLLLSLLVLTPCPPLSPPLPSLPLSSFLSPSPFPYPSCPSPFLPSSPSPSHSPLPFSFTPLSFLSIFLFLPFFLERTKFPRWSLGKNMWRKRPFRLVQSNVVLGGATEGACDHQRGRGHVGRQPHRCRGSTIFIREGKEAVGWSMKLTKALSTGFMHKNPL